MKRFIIEQFILGGVVLAMAAYGQTEITPYTWTAVSPPLTAARADACAAALSDGSAIVSGGIGLDGNSQSSVDLFQTGSGMSSAPAMNDARAGHTCTTLQDGRILVAGGTDGQGGPVGTVEIFDPETQTWEVAADLNEPRWGHTATLLHNGRVVIAGGKDGNGPKASIEIFEPKISAMVPAAAQLSSPRVNSTAMLLGNRLVAILGGSNGMSSLASVDLYDPRKDEVLAAAPLLTARAFHSASLLPNGTILVAGGWDGQQDLATAEIYDVSKGSSLTLGKLANARHGHFALTLPGNGNVLLGGGMGGNSPLATTEIYSFSDGTFLAAGSLTTPRARATAVAVGGSQVLSAGGVSTDGVTPVTSCGVLPAPAIDFSLAGFIFPYNGNLIVHGTNFPAHQRVPMEIDINSPDRSETSFIESAESLGSFDTGTGTFNLVTNSLTKPGHTACWQLAAGTTGPRIVQLKQVIFANVALAASCNPCAFGTKTNLTASVTAAEPSFSFARPGQDFCSLSGLVSGIPVPSVDPVTFNDGGNKLGTSTLNNSTSTATAGFNLPPGNHSLTASIGFAPPTPQFLFQGPVNPDGYFGQSSTVTVVVSPIPTTLPATANPDPVKTGTTVKLSAAVQFDTTLNSKLGKNPTGLLTFKVGSVLMLQAPASQLVSSVSVPAPAPGSYIVTVSYSGDANYAPSTSLPFNLNVTK